MAAARPVIPASDRRLRLDSGDFGRISPDTYAFLTSLAEAAEKVRDVALKVFPKELHEEMKAKGCAVLVTGSEGRKENRVTAVGRSCSRMDALVIFREGPVDRDLADRVMAAVRAISEFDPYEDVHSLTAESPKRLQCPSGDLDQRILPTLVLDAAPFAGDEAVHKAYLKRSYADIKEVPLRTFTQGHIRFVKRELQLVIEGKSSHADLSAGLLTMDPGSYSKTTKYWLLRPVQYTIAHRICLGIKDGSISEEDFFALNAMTIPERIDFLHRKGVLKISDEVAKSTIRAYVFGLKVHLDALDAWAKACAERPDVKSPLFIETDKELLERHAHAVKAFIDSF